MARPTESFPELSPEALLGRPLNEVERKHTPESFFAAGDVELARRGVRVAIVGARQASSPGLKRAKRLATELANQGVVVVSGLAEGIDTAAHWGAILAGGRTIAVLGTPLDRCYPQKNQELQRKIMQEHLALSQFPRDRPVLQRNFPRRNRVMALLSDATVIVEAGDTSGSIAQGWEAIRLGRLVFVMKSATEVPGLDWPRKLLSYGAQVLTTTRSLLRLLPVEPEPALAELAF